SEEEFLAGIGAPDDLISKGLQVLGWLSGTDHHLHWRAATCGRQRWRCKHHEVHASDLRDFALDLLHRRGGTGLALIPLLEYETGNGAVGHGRGATATDTVEQEQVLARFQIIGNGVQLARVGFYIVERHIRIS